MRDDVRSISLTLSLWDVGMRGMGGRQRLIMENGEEREKEGEEREREGGRDSTGENRYRVHKWIGYGLQNVL